MNTTHREEGKALVTQATDEQSQQTNAVTYIQVLFASNWQQFEELHPFPPLQNLLELKDRFDSFLNNSFSNDKFFKQVSLSQELFRGFESFFDLKCRSYPAILSTSST